MPWLSTPEGALSLVILLDQYPHNAFRGTDRMYATDTLGRIVAGTLGAYPMAGGLGLYLKGGDDRHFPLILVGSLLALLGTILFLVIVLIDALAVRSGSTRFGTTTL